MMGEEAVQLGSTRSFETAEGALTYPELSERLAVSPSIACYNVPPIRSTLRLSGLARDIENWPGISFLSGRVVSIHWTSRSGPSPLGSAPPTPMGAACTCPPYEPAMRAIWPRFNMCGSGGREKRCSQVRPDGSPSIHGSRSVPSIQGRCGVSPSAPIDVHCGMTT
jgi:hypothetical protein